MKRTGALLAVAALPLYIVLGACASGTDALEHRGPSDASHTVASATSTDPRATHDRTSAATDQHAEGTGTAADSSAANSSDEYVVHPDDLPKNSPMKSAHLNVAPSTGTCTDRWRLPDPSSRSRTEYEVEISGPYLYSEAGSYANATAVFRSIVVALRDCDEFSERSPDGATTTGRMRRREMANAPSNLQSFSIDGDVNGIPISGAFTVATGKSHLAVILTVTSGPAISLGDFDAASRHVAERLQERG